MCSLIHRFSGQNLQFDMVAGGISLVSKKVGCVELSYAVDSELFGSGKGGGLELSSETCTSRQEGFEVLCPC